MMRGQAILLTGGASRRMGTDKSKILVDGVPSSERILRLLAEDGWDPIVLGREPVASFPFQEDRTEFGGPLTALREFVPQQERVFVASCDLFRFESVVASTLDLLLGARDASVPRVRGRLQPLCAVYSNRAFDLLHSEGALMRVMDWLALLDVVVADEAVLAAYGISPEWVLGVNTPDELNALEPQGK